MKIHVMLGGRYFTFHEPNPFICRSWVLRHENVWIEA